MLPSVKTLESAFPGRGKDLRKILEMKRSELCRQDAGERRVAECYNPPTTADIRMHVLNSVGGFYGVEYVAHKDDTYTESMGFDYLNIGDSYVPTIVRSCQSGNYRVTTIADLVERNSKLI
jgi:hypothetical protein